MPTRHEIFETNSSSSHSISINKNINPKLYDTITVDDKGVVTLFTGQFFGWGHERYNTAEIKASYCVISASYSSDAQKLTNNIIKVIKDHTGANFVSFDKKNQNASPNSEGFLNPLVKIEGDIDHQSIGTVDSTLLNDPQKLKDFIFHPNSWLFISNDNDTPGRDFYYPPERIAQFELQIKGTNKLYPIDKLDHYSEDINDLAAEMLSDLGLKYKWIAKVVWDDSHNTLNITYNILDSQGNNYVQKTESIECNLFQN